MRGSFRNSVVGNFTRSIRPMATDDAFIEEETSSNYRASVIMNFNIKEDYIKKGKK